MHTRAGVVAGSVAVAVVMSVSLAAAPAWAHQGAESAKAADLVRQAVALIVNTPANGMAIEDKVNDALNSTQPQGVNLDVVRRAKAALAAGDLHLVRALLEVSIGARPHLTNAEVRAINETAGPPSGAEVEGLVTGAESGTNVAIDALAARRRFDAGTWLALAASFVVALAGVALAVRYRPPDSIRSLRAGAAGPKEA